MASAQRWIPLESNPSVLNKYIENLGVEGDFQFVDIYGLEAELLSMIPRPVLAVMLLYPLTDKAKGTAIGEVSGDSGDCYFMRQTIHNACGTVALVHALSNNTNHIKLADDKHFKKFWEATKNKNPEERGKYLEEDKGMGVAHEESAQEGDTQAPSREDSAFPHFVAFIHHSGNLFEMDGRKEAPVCHGKTSQETLLEDSIAVVKKFMERDPDEINFTLMALAKKDH